MKSIFAFDPSVDPQILFSDVESWKIDQIIIHPGFLENPAFLKCSEKSDRGLWLNLPVFNNPSWLEEHPESFAIDSLGNKASHLWLAFVCSHDERYFEHFLELAESALTVRREIFFIRQLRSFHR